MITVEQIVSVQKTNVETLFDLTNTAFEGVEKLIRLNLQVAKTAMTEAAANSKAPAMLLRRSIISRPEHGVQLGQSSGLH